MLLRHSPNNVCYSRIVRSASIPNNGHITLVMLALAFLTSITLAARRSACPLLPVAPPPADALLGARLCPLSVPEARRLLARLLFPPPSSAPLVLSWSGWRRRHQQQAHVCHGRHRLKAS